MPDKETGTGELPEAGVTPSPEGLEAQNKEVEQLRSELQKMEQNLKSAQGVSRKQTQDFEELRGKYDQAISSRDTYQALIGLLSQQTGRSEEDIEEEVRIKKPDLMKQAQTIMQQQDQRRQYDTYIAKVREYQTKTEALGLTPQDVEYWDILDAAKNAYWPKADLLLSKAEGKKVEKEPEKKAGAPKSELSEDDEEKIARKYMEKKGWLTPEAGSPSASETVFSKQALINMPIEEYEKIKPAVDKARKEGRIK